MFCKVLEVVSIGLVWFCFVPFSYSGVCFLRVNFTIAIRSLFEQTMNQLWLPAVQMKMWSSTYLLLAGRRIVRPIIWLKLTCNAICTYLCCVNNYSPAQSHATFLLHWNFFDLPWRHLQKALIRPNILLCMKTHKIREKYTNGDYYCLKAMLWS